MIRHVTRATRHLIFWTLLLAAVVLSAVRLGLIGIETFKSTLATRISEQVGVPVKLKAIGAKMRGISPELILKEIDVDVHPGTGKPAIHLDEARIGINLASFLVNRSLLSSSWVTLVGAHLSVYRNADGGFAVEGLAAGKGQPLWLLQGRQYLLLDSQVKFKDVAKDTEVVKLDAVNVAIMNDGDHHRVNLLAQLPERYGKRLTILVDCLGKAEQLDNISGTVFVEGDQVKLSKQLTDYFPDDLAVSSGSADVKLWVSLRQAEVADIKGEVKLKNSHFTRSGKSQFTVNHLDSQFHWQATDKQWQLDVGRFLLESRNDQAKTAIQWSDLTFSLASEQMLNTGLKKYKLSARRLDLAEVVGLMGYFPQLPDELARQLEQIRISGTLKDLTAYAEPETKQFAVSGWFEGLALEPLRLPSGTELPGLANLSGQFKGSDKRGKIKFNSRDVSLTAAQLFLKPLLFKQFNALVDWQQKENQWLLASRSMQLASAAFSTESRMAITVPKAEGKPFMDLQASLISDDMSKIVNYLPTKVMTLKLQNWLGAAFVRGKIANGGFLFYGGIDDFPFKDGSGVVEANFDIDDVELKFNPDWLPISGIHGQLHYENNDIRGIFDRGVIGKAEIARTEMLIPNLGSKEEQLFINGEAQGEINQVLSVLQQSPLADRIMPFLSGATVKGTTKGKIALVVPLWPGQEMKLDGNAQFNNAELIVSKLGMKVNKIVGALKYNMDGIYSDDIQAFALGQPIQVNVGQSEQGTAINVAGMAKVSDVENLFNWPKSLLAEGEGAYQLQLQIPKAGLGQPTQVNITSNLEGFTLTLPGALSKTASQRKPSSVTIGFTDQAAMPIEVNYNNELKAAINYDAANQKITAGHILVGSGGVLPRLAPGIKFEINKSPLPLQDWLALAASQNQAEAADIDLREVSIQSSAAFWKKTRLGDFGLTLTRNLDGWSGEIDSAVAKGSFQMPSQLQGAKPIVMEMSMLSLSALKQFQLPNSQIETHFKPALKIHSKRILWQTVNLGQLDLETVRTAQGMTIKTLNLKGADEKLEVTGDWLGDGTASTTHVKGKLDMKKADRFFDKLRITKDLTETDGAIDFNLSWRGAPWSMSLPDLRGQIVVNLNSGRILSVEPGFGRLLGILAVAQWLKRLQFDFSDIFAEGMAFDSIKGDIDLANAKATTKNLVIDAVPASITVTGDTDLAKQAVDYVIKVVPKSSDAVPIAGTIVGELAALVGKTLTGKDQKGFFFGKQYLVKGSWDDAKISPLRENDGLFQKTWSSITDFSWLGQGDDVQK